MVDELAEFKQRARRYLHSRDIYADETDIQISRTTSSVHGTDWIATIDIEGDSWWLIGGSTPITLNKQDEFRNIQEVYYFHVGVADRLINRRDIENPQTFDSDLRHAFINHASEDKADFVKPLFEELTKKGLYIWYDNNEITAGKSIRRSIEAGLQINAYGISVLSETYFGKSWAQEELDILVDQQTTAGKTIIIPIWYGVSSDDVRNHNSTLASRYAITGDETCVSEVADEIFESIVNDAKDEGRSLIPLDEDILGPSGNDDSTESGGLSVTDIMRSHNVHYFDGRYFEQSVTNQTEASKIIDQLGEADDIHRITSDHRTPLDGLGDGDYIIADVSLSRTPLNRFNQLFQNYRRFLDMEDQFDGQEGQMILNQIEDAAEYFKAEMPPGRDGDFVFKLSQNHTFHNLSEYVDDRREHSIFATVKHVYNERERDHFLDILNDAPGRSRKERSEQRMRLKKMANELDNFSDENVSESDFYIAHPDITLTPIAVYD